MLHHSILKEGMSSIALAKNVTLEGRFVTEIRVKIFHNRKNIIIFVINHIFHLLIEGRHTISLQICVHLPIM